MAKRKQIPPVTLIKTLALELQRRAAEASTKAMILNTKAEWADRCEQNGASLDSVAEKLGWSVGKLRGLLEPDADIEIRELADMFTAIGREVHFRANVPQSQSEAPQ